MRSYLLFITLCVIVFCVPLQIFVIGNDMGIGIQGAVYRFQVTEYGNYFFPITREMVFVQNGTLTGKSALSVILWVAGTILLVCTTIFSFIHARDMTSHYYRQIVHSIIIMSTIYLGSCIAQYGFFFHGPAGISLPFGIVIILTWTLIIWFFNDAIEKSLCIK